jgi:hypothetical protein
MTNDTHDATGPHPCRLVVEPGDLFGLALGLPPDQRRAAIRAAMLMRAFDRDPLGQIVPASKETEE